MARQVIAIALGSRNTQALLLEHTSAGVAVADYFAHEAPRAAAANEAIPAENYTELFRKIRQHFGGKVRNAVLTLSYRDSLLGRFDLPAHAPAMLRASLHMNARTFLRKDYPADHLFDCRAQKLQAAHPEARPGAGEGNAGADPKGADPASPAPARPSKKAEFLVGSAPRDLLDRLYKAARAAGLRLDLVTPVQMAQIQALKLPNGAHTSLAVANLDIGSEQSCISILVGDELAQSRVVNFGGNTLTRGLAEAMKVTHEAAESVKVLLPQTVEAKLNALLEPLATELKESIEFFEAHFEKKIGLVYLSGGTARSPVIFDSNRPADKGGAETIRLDASPAAAEPRNWVEKLERSLQIPCQVWHLPDSIAVTMAEATKPVFGRDLPQMMGAIGAGVEWLGSVSPGINVLATLLEEEKRRLRNPLRIGVAASAFLFALMLVWSATLGWKLRQLHGERQDCLKELMLLNRTSAEVKMLARMQCVNLAKARELIPSSTNRFLAAPILDALQRCTTNDIVVTKLTLERVVPVPSGDSPAKPPPKKAPPREILQLTIKAKDYSELGATDRFIDTIAANSFFKQHLRAISLKDRSQRQVDTANPARSFAMVTIECTLTE